MKIKTNVHVHCPEEEMSQNILRLAEKAGYKLSGPEGKWHYKEKTVYIFDTRQKIILTVVDSEILRKKFNVRPFKDLLRKSIGGELTVGDWTYLLTEKIERVKCECCGTIINKTEDYYFRGHVTRKIVDESLSDPTTILYEVTPDKFSEEVYYSMPPESLYVLCDDFLYL